MKRIEVRLSLEAVAPLLDVMRAEAKGMRGSLASPLAMTDLDGEMRAMWEDNLLEQQNATLQSLLDLFDGEFFREGVIILSEDNAEPVIRACAAVRLRLRAGTLRGLSDEIMESGEVDVGGMAEPQRRAFMCYLFLATLQELIIQHLEYPEA